MFLVEQENVLVHPIYCPSIKLINRFGQHDSYSSTNPSLFIKNDGSYILLIRNVNYRKFSDYSFTLSESKSQSHYFILKGQDIRKLNSQLRDFKEVRISYQRPTYNTYWLGIEDVRFIDEENILTVVPELHPQGIPTIFKASLSENHIFNFEWLVPNEISEKNWMPIEKRDHLIYTLCPLIIRDFSGKEIYRSENKTLSQFHGSTNGISYQDGYLFIIHREKEHKWLFLSQDYKEIKVSDSFSFFFHTYIEFCCSLCLFEEKLYISLGCNDNSAFIITFPIDKVDLKAMKSI